MRIVGLTGGISSGKSTVSNLFKSRGIPVVDADIVARNVVRKGTGGWKKIKKEFGDAILLESGELDRARLGQIVFSDPEKRQLLNRLSEPGSMSKDKTTPPAFDFVAAFQTLLQSNQQIVQGQNELMHRLELAEGRLLSLEQLSKTGERHRPQDRATGSETQGVPRYHKLDFPTFDGKEDPLSWINRCEQFFRGQRTVEEEKVWLAAYHLTGIAQQWYFQLERDVGLLPWVRFKELCHLRFGPPVRTNPLGELMHLRQTDSVEEYQERFGALICRADSVTPTQQMHIFTAGLSEPLRTDVELHKPSDLQHAMSLARAFERRYRTTPVASNLPKPPEVLAILASSESGPEQRSLRRLNPIEMAERRQKGFLLAPHISTGILWEVIKLWLKGCKVIILDIPLLFETKMNLWTHPVIVVWVDPETQIQRLMARDGISEEQARNRIEAQMPLDLKREKADLVIDNSGSLEETKVKFDQVLARVNSPLSLKERTFSRDGVLSILLSVVVGIVVIKKNVS
ncbi:hypothetical protein LUZ62_048320 [Rhynchospora pubera]|uniref:Retrotransposon gag domain-containing protein n=1 Tax=Rhynchospora pubera TaxID=906938 RepID=A0AAV8FU87_9POAL|nr:hypothetical protein LUZ62_048320 [Rhynchospora pubera]